ncbi:uncharacterized protein LAJ45_02376 [Morchella importuna]|uniref:uncharacterized protein n=1 Tax=Morchella importuna TaxID=1174673 RepID=UPI001E8E37E0|nr:uncharacterized protein LAJ45_02376 [Morchella importuna]KAH8153563.1 hypothetical protein LAJ45_02376 [Morchella importuna]
MSRLRTKEKPIAVQESDDDIDDDEEDEEVEEENPDGVFELPEKLEECHWQRRSITDLYDMMSSPFLDLNPDYQRDVVWNSDRMTKLINSLICNYYIPPVIFNVQTIKTEEGGERFLRISIDGKQRLSSIREFVNGNIPCTDKHGRKWFFKDNGSPSGKKKRLLNEKFKQHFLSQELLCAEYAALERKQEEDLFSRVQLGVPLTPAEKLRASSGAWQAFALEIEQKYPNLMQTVDNRRGRSFQLILQIFKQILNSEDQNSKYSAGAISLKAFCERTNLLDEPFRATVKNVFYKYNEILKRHPETFQNHNYTHATKYSPIEFVASALLIHQHPNRTNPTLLSGDILKMRQVVREERQDLRSNSSTWSSLMNRNVQQNMTPRDGVREVQNLNTRTPEGSNNVQQSVAPGKSGPQARRLSKRAVPSADSYSPAPSSLQSPHTHMGPGGEFEQHREALASQRYSIASLPPRPSTSQTQAPTAPLRQPAAECPGDRFMAITRTHNRITNEAWNESSLGGSTSYSSPQRPIKRPRIENEASRIKREE